jgi:predicted DCC family thiol-disulfide oxidoreductase YuxK
MAWKADDGRPMVLLFDGQCLFCIASARRLAAWARPGAVELADFHDPGVHARLAHVRLPEHVTLTLVGPGGELATGAEATFRTLATRPLWRLVTWLYWVPGLHTLYNAAYALIARHRYRIMGRAGACESGACGLEPVEGRRG